MICLPETNREQAEELARKIYDLIRLQLNIRMPIGVASFPDDGLIYKYLIEAAGKNLLTFASERKGAGGAGAEDKLTTQERAALQPFTVDFGFGKMSGQGELTQPLRKSSSTFILSLGLRALLHGGDLMQPFVAQRPHHHDVSPYYTRISGEPPAIPERRLRRVYCRSRAMALALLALSLPSCCLSARRCRSDLAPGSLRRCMSAAHRPGRVAITMYKFAR